MGALETQRRVITVTPTVDTAIYASGDQLGSLMTLSGALPGNPQGVIDSLTIVDKSSQKSVLNVLFFSASPTVTSSDNAALNISDSEMASKCLGYVPVAAADYKDLSASAVATIRNVGLNVSRSGDDLYAIILSGGTPTYTSTSDLVLKIGFRIG